MQMKQGNANIISGNKKVFRNRKQKSFVVGLWIGEIYIKYYYNCA